jgi:hypothetical protein
MVQRWTLAFVGALVVSQAATALAAPVVVDEGINWIKENVQAVINNDIWAWLALAGFIWEGFLWKGSRRMEHIAGMVGCAIFGAVWMKRDEIAGALGAM